MRVLLADDPDLAPRLDRLRDALGGAWDLLLCPADQSPFWAKSGLLGPKGRVTPIAQIDSALPASEAADVVVAGTTPELLKVASRLAFRRGSQTAVLPAAAQTADWIFSLYPLSEGVPPRVRGVLEHRQSGVVEAFEQRLPPAVAGRHLIATCTLPVRTLTTADIENQLVQNVDLFRRLGGEFKNLIAVGIPDDADGYRSLTVTFGGEGAGHLAWSLQPGAAFDWQLKGADRADMDLRGTPDGRFQMDGVDSRVAGPATVDWENVLRAFDDLAALRRSLKRRRMVELQTETISERAQFKSLMSASGCGLLVMTLIGAVVLLALGAALDPRESLQRTSERAGLVLRADDFVADQAALVPDASAEWPGMVRRLSHSAAPILVERVSEQLDGRRRETLVQDLQEAGVPGPASRVEMYRFRGDLFLKLLTAAWIVLFLPLGIFLAVQALLLVAPKTDHAPT
ncbi:MAG TPA: hypothetical protein VM452_11280 [Caulifigura sp.]|jgi:hypothetical protein|nr:hypothetical protein [Caulifigura sp.]